MGRWYKIGKENCILNYEVMESGKILIYKDYTVNEILERAIDLELKKIELENNWNRVRVKK